MPRGHIPRTAKGLHQAHLDSPLTAGGTVEGSSSGKFENLHECRFGAHGLGTFLRSGKPLDVCVETVEVGTCGGV